MITLVMRARIARRCRVILAPLHLSFHTCLPNYIRGAITDVGEMPEERRDAQNFSPLLPQY